MAQLSYLYALALDRLEQCEQQVLHLDTLNAQTYRFKLKFLGKSLNQAYQEQDETRLLECAKILISIQEGIKRLVSSGKPDFDKQVV